MKKDLSEIALVQPRKAWDFLGIAWVELSKDWLPIKIPHCTLSISLSPSNQRRPYHRESGSTKTRLGTMNPPPSLFDRECSPLLPVVTIRTQAKELKTATQAPLTSFFVVFALPAFRKVNNNQSSP